MIFIQSFTPETTGVRYYYSQLLFMLFTLTVDLHSQALSYISHLDPKMTKIFIYSCSIQQNPEKFPWHHATPNLNLSKFLSSYLRDCLVCLPCQLSGAWTPHSYISSFTFNL